MHEKKGHSEFVESGKILHEADYMGHNDAEDIKVGVSVAVIISKSFQTKQSASSITFCF